MSRIRKSLRKRTVLRSALRTSLRGNNRGGGMLERAQRALNREILRREQVEAALLQSAGRLARSERLFGLLARHAHDVIFIIGADHVCTYISPAIERLTGHTPGELVGSKISSIVHEPWRPFIEKARRRRSADEAGGQRNNAPVTWELELMRTDGSLVWTETLVSPLRGEGGILEGFLGVARDISSRKRAEAELEQAHRDMSAIISAITAILVLVDGGGRITHLNAAACRAFGIEAATAKGTALAELPLGFEAQELETLLSEMRRCGDEGGTCRLDDLRYPRPDGSEGLLGLTLYPVEGGGVLVLARDISEARVREQRQAHEQKMQSIGRLAAGIAHEINTPVQYLGFNAGFLESAFAETAAVTELYRELRKGLERGDSRESLAHLSQRIAAMEEAADLEYLLKEAPLAIANSKQGVEQITRIVQAMRQLSHPGRLARSEMGLVDVNAMISSAVVVTRNEWKRHAEVEQRLDPTVPLIPGWGAELGQVMVNLLLNAAQAEEEAHSPQTPVSMDDRGPGRIVVSTSYLPGEREEEALCEIVVEDDASGVPEELRARIFEPFFTTKEVGRGSGQGLAIVHAIVVEQHGGSIAAEDSPLGGALFRIRLPAVRPNHGEV